MSKRLTLVDGEAPFPPLHTALREPNGLLAVGGDLSPSRVLRAYSAGIFPWYGEDDPILWWSPDPRAVFEVDSWQANRALRRCLRTHGFRVTLNYAFDRVIHHCATQPRAGQDGTWITREMLHAYKQLFYQGFGFSVEVWDEQTLVGGLYGLHIGHMCFGESMFSQKEGASKFAIHALLQHLKNFDLPLLDAQVGNEHTRMLGTTLISRERYMTKMTPLLSRPLEKSMWQPQELSYQATGSNL